MTEERLAEINLKWDVEYNLWGGDAPPREELKPRTTVNALRSVTFSNSEAGKSRDARETWLREIDRGRCF